MNHNKGFAPIVAIIMAVIVIAGGIGGYVYLNKDKSILSNKIDNSSPSSDVDDIDQILNYTNLLTGEKGTTTLRILQEESELSPAKRVVVKNFDNIVCSNSDYVAVKTIYGYTNYRWDGRTIGDVIDYNDFLHNPKEIGIELNPESYAKLRKEIYGDGFFPQKNADLNKIKDLTCLTHFNGRELSITDVSPLAKLRNLTYLDLGNNYKISDLTPLANLTNLKRLNLEYNNITNITPLVSLIKLENLDLRSNKISDITSLANLTNLRTLGLDVNTSEVTITDLSPLIRLDKLITLFLNFYPNATKESKEKFKLDVSSIAELNNLEYLSASNAGLTDIDIQLLSDLTKLNGLGIAFNKITNIAPLLKLNNLKDVSIVGNKILASQCIELKQNMGKDADIDCYSLPDYHYSD